jgi:hypothetical protein
MVNWIEFEVQIISQSTVEFVQTFQLINQMMTIIIDIV